MTENQDKTPAAEVQQDVIHANEANVKTEAKATTVNELSDEALDEVAGGGILKKINNGNWAVGNDG